MLKVVHGGCEVSVVGPCLTNNAYEFQLTIGKLPNSTMAINGSILIESSNSRLYSGLWSQSTLSSTCPGFYLLIYNEN